MIHVTAPQHWFMKLIQVKGNNRADRLAGKATFTSGLFSEDLKSGEAWDKPAGTKPRTSPRRLPGGEMRWKRKRQTIFLERTREGHRQSDEHWNRFKCNFGETSKRLGGAHNYGLFRAHKYHLELNWTDSSRWLGGWDADFVFKYIFVVVLVNNFVYAFQETVTESVSFSAIFSVHCWLLHTWCHSKVTN